MSKTNFKCMFLIDDKLYKKAILKENADETSIPKTRGVNSYHLNLVSGNQQPMNRSSEMGGMDEKQKLTDKSEDALFVSDAGLNEPVPDLSGTEKNSNSLVTSSDMSIDQDEKDSEDCECYDDTLPAAKKRRFSGAIKEKEVDEGPPKKLKKKGPVIKAKFNKKRVSPAKKIKNTKLPLPEAKDTIMAEDSDESDESDWEELRERYRRLRGDYDSPTREKEPRGKSNLQKSSALTKNKTHTSRAPKVISYLCTICNQTFKKQTALQKHVNDMHSEYFKKRSNKRKKKSTDIQSKRLEIGGSKKRKAENKPAVSKKKRKEIQCEFCHSYYKTEQAYNRHYLNIHGKQEGSKRSKNEDIGRYIKRRKNNNNIAVSYLNYF